MKYITKRVFALVIVVLLVASFFSVTAQAATKITNDDLADMVKFARSKEGKGRAALGLPENDWCSYFAGYCINNSKVGKALGNVNIKSYPTAPDLADWICNKKKAGHVYMFDKVYFDRMRGFYSPDLATTGRMELVKQSSFTPKVGDLILFNNDNRQTTWFHHVAIVSKVTSKTVGHIDGNSGSSSYNQSKVVVHEGNSATNRDSLRIIGYIRIDTADPSTTTATTTPVVDTKISFSGIKAPNNGTLELGKGYHIDGKVTSTGGKISKIEAKVTDRDGTTVIKKSRTVNGKSYTLYDSSLDWDLAFGSLPAGLYKLTYTATPDKGKAVTTSTSFTVILPSKWYTLSPQNAPKSNLDVKSGSKDNGANVQIWAANKNAQQKWKLTHVGNGWYVLTSNSSGKALDVQGARATAGTNVQQYTVNGTAAQKWYLQSVGDGNYVLLSNLNSKLALDVNGAKTVNGTNVQIYTRNDSAAQSWKIKVA